MTIADYVADLRAPTPSAAAELAVFDASLFDGQLLAAAGRLKKALTARRDAARHELEKRRLSLRLYSPQSQLNARRQRLADGEDRLRRLMDGTLSRRRHALALYSERLDGLSPLKRISGGFGFVTGGDGKRICSAGAVKPGDRVCIRVSDGRIDASVTGSRILSPQKEGTA